MRIISTGDNSFAEIFSAIQKRGKVFDPILWEQVAQIVNQVAEKGDEALFGYTARFDGHAVDRNTVEISRDDLHEAASQVDKDDRAIMELAAARIRRFHEAQITGNVTITEENGTELGNICLPLERVGVYAPGGLNPYPSTVLMAVIPAKIAGVTEVVLVSPSKTGTINPLTAAAAVISGVDRIFNIGGAQAIAALAYGTESIPRVDKIVGPGNAYVTAAKKMVYGQCDIDMIAGPSEVLVVADGTGNPAHAAADLLSQAEHDEMASAVLVTPDTEFGKKVAAEVDKQVLSLSRRAIAEKSLTSFGAVIITKDMDEAVDIANRFAPEHLELMVASPKDIAKKIRHAGAVFMGYHTPETLGDYLAGPNHVLPTGGTARFSSPLGVYDFVRRMSVLSFAQEALSQYGRQAARFAAMEGLDAHEKSVLIRLNCG